MPRPDAATITLTIDGREVSVPAGTSVMRAASLSGSKIPKLCATEQLEAFGSCRLCLVQIDGMNRAAGSQQFRKRGCERASAATKITPALRSHPFNKGCMNERGGLTDLHLSTVLVTGGKAYRN